MLLNRWVRRLTRQTSGTRLRRRTAPERCCRPRLEALEQRALLSAGALDPTFGSGGTVITPFPSTNGIVFDLANAVAVQPDGKIVVAGWADTRPSAFLLARYNPEGTLDTGFGNGGLVITAARDGAGALTPDGKIVAAGRAQIGLGDGALVEFAVARYESEPSLQEKTTIVVPPGLEELLGVLRLRLRGVPVLLGGGRLRQRLWLVNQGGALDGPVWLVLVGLRHKVHLRNLTEISTVVYPTNPCKEVLPAGAVLPPGGRLSVVLVFRDPSGAPVHYVPHLFAGPGTP
jgi:uncharacterized delta-60 repeat protein